MRPLPLCIARLRLHRGNVITRWLAMVFGRHGVWEVDGYSLAVTQWRGRTFLIEWGDVG